MTFLANTHSKLQISHAKTFKESILGDSTIVLWVVRIFVKQMLYVNKRVNSEQVSSLNFIQQKLGTYLENEVLQKVKVFKKNVNM